MKFSAVVVISAALLQCATGTFTVDGIGGGNVGDPNAFDLTNILDCAADAGSDGRLTVGLTQPPNGSFNSYWLPDVAK